MVAAVTSSPFPLVIMEPGRVMVSERVGESVVPNRQDPDRSMAFCAGSVKVCSNRVSRKTGCLMFMVLMGVVFVEKANINKKCETDTLFWEKSSQNAMS